MKKMRRIMQVLLAVIVVLSLTMTVKAQNMNKENQSVLAPFPKAEAGMVRHVIELKKKANEELFKVEIIPGKTMSVDCNRHVLSGKIIEKDVQGWGYTYYVFESNGQAMSTMMACNEPNKDRFITGQTLIVRYNSKLPIVVYAPQGFEVKYRIWKAEKEKSAVEK